jgi:hypothetical protein
MTTYSTTYSRRIAPTTATGEWAYLSVETPSVFREHRLPILHRDRSLAERKLYAELDRLAERYGTSIITSAVRRG